MMIKNVRLSFPDLFIAKKFNEDDKSPAKYSAMFILAKDHPQIAEITAEIKSVKAAKWTDPSIRPIVCLRDGADKSGAGFGEGVFFFNASNVIRPTVINKDKSPLTAGDGLPYAGCYVDVSIEFWAQDNKFGKRINATLKGVQFRDHGEAFGGGSGPTSADEFDDLGDVGEAVAVATDDALADMLG
jgi:hypothetical protein